MKLYTASSFENRMNLHPMRERLTEMGHVVTSRWLDERPDIVAEEAAATDLEDIRSADALVLWPDTDNFGPGRFIEFGYALALGLDVYVINAPARGIFFKLPVVRHFENWDKFYLFMEEQ